MKKKVFNSILTQILYIAVSGIVGLSLVPMTLHMLGTETYGAFELILSLLLIDTFLEFGLGSTIIKYVPEYKSDMATLRSFFWSYYYVKLAIAIAASVFIGFVGYHFEDIFNLGQIQDIESIKISVYLFAIGLIINSLVGFLDNFLRGYVFFGIANTIKTFALLLFFVVYYFYYITGTPSTYSIIWISFMWFVLRPTFSLLLMVGGLRFLSLGDILHPAKFEFSHIENTRHYVYGMTYIVMLAQLLNRLPKIMLGIFINPAHVAYWGIMEKIKEPLLQLNAALLRPLIPILSDQKNSIQMSEDKIIQLSRLQYLLMTFLGIMVVTHIDLLVKLWIGEEFKMVAKIVKIDMLPLLFPMAGIFLMMYYAEGKTYINRQFVTINAVVGLGIGLLVLWRTRDIVMFAWSLSLVSIIIALLNLLVYLRYYKINKEKMFSEAFVVPAAIMGVYYLIIKSILHIFPQNIYGLAMSIGVSCLIYMILCYIFLPKQDRDIIADLRKGKSA